MRTIIILGMHRSGTSCLTGSLEEAGLFLGNVNRKAPYNKKGNCESKTIMKMHDDLLTSNGGSWDHPPDKTAWRQRHRDIRDSFINGYQSQLIWGFKDPRTLFTVEGWLEALPQAEFVGIFRDPLSVAQSLKHRNQFSFRRSLTLWTQYNKRLILLHEKFNFPVIHFDKDGDTFLQKLNTLCARLQLPEASKKKSFFEKDLRNSTAHVDYETPLEVTHIHRHLQSIAI